MIPPLITVFWRSRLKYLFLKPLAVFACVFLLILLIYFGRISHRPYSKYPLEDAHKYVDQLMSGLQPDVPPINQYLYRFIIANQYKCEVESTGSEPYTLVVMVKSAVNHFKRRNAIRGTWGREVLFPEVTIRRVFHLGSTTDKLVVRKVTNEQQAHNDIVQSDFTDSYSNNTIKAMMGFRWLMENCKTADFVLFVDDDYYVSMTNVLHFLSSPHTYPKNVNPGRSKFRKKSLSNFWAGYTYFNGKPHRNKVSKWYVSHEEYSFDRYPPFVTAGAFVLSFQALRRMYYTSMYTAHFRFDDIYLALLADKAGIQPVHCEYFYNLRRNFPNDFRFVIAAHGYGNASDVIPLLWNKFKVQFQQ